MIYDFPESSSPIRQGDIFIGIPILDLPDDELSVIDDEGSVQTLPWEEFASAGEKVSAIIAVRPTIAIVGTQECDALRAPNITLFEVRPFRDVERKSKDTSKPSKWVPIITQHARVNQKWFYLPADKRVGFSEKMGADFLTPIRIPRIVLERLINFRKGRLNEVAGQHFRERLSEFFRRYAYDEWYPLTQEELAEYQKNNPNVEPYSWQKDATEEDTAAPGLEQHEEVGQKGFLDYLNGSFRAMSELTDIMNSLNEETRISTSKIGEQVQNINKLAENPSLDSVEKLTIYYQRMAGDINTFSRKIEEINLRLEKNVGELAENVSGYIDWISYHQQIDPVEVAGFSEQLGILGRAAKEAGENYRGARDSSQGLGDKNISLALTSAARRNAKAINGLVLNIEEVESFCLKTQFMLDDKFGEGLSSKDKAE